ncbi:MAG: flagellin [Pseudomonadota bacterium]
MEFLGLPDLLASGRLQRRVAQVSSDLVRASEETTTGRYADIIAASNNNPARIAGLERALTLNDSRAGILDIAGSRAATAQEALGVVQGAIETFGPELLASVSINDISSADRKALPAREAFETAVSALNTRFSGRSLFAGAASDQAALAPGDQILAEIQTLTAAAPDAGTVIAVVDAYFAPGGGFEATGYVGSVNDAPAVELAEGARLDYAVRADDERIRGALRSLALAVVGAEGSFTNADDGSRLLVLREAAESAIAATPEVIDVRAALGVAEERIEVASVRTEGERTFLNQALNAIVQRDQFEAATELTSLEQQLQTIFAITARLSQLNLNNFLR